MDKRSHHPILDQWIAAQAQAQQAQLALSRAHLQELRGGPPVPDHVIDAARTLTLKANFLLPEVLAEMERLARAERKNHVH